VRLQQHCILTVSSKQLIQQTSEVLRVGPVAWAPHFWKQPDAKPARSTASLMALSLQAFDTRFTTSATFHVTPYPAEVVEYQSPLVAVHTFFAVFADQHSYWASPCRHPREPKWLLTFSKPTFAGHVLFWVEDPHPPQLQT
jgi:hypothetical protein